MEARLLDVYQGARECTHGPTPPAKAEGIS
jgi:hypothetical protein